MSGSVTVFVPVRVSVRYRVSRMTSSVRMYCFSKSISSVPCTSDKVNSPSCSADKMEISTYLEVPQDAHLSDNQKREFRCGDNGIFRGMPVTDEQRKLTKTARELFSAFLSDGKYVLDGDRLIICQSNASTRDLRAMFPGADVNPLGNWTGGSDVDSGATNRKLGSDMGDSVTGGGLHGKDLSKADVSVNIYAWLKAQTTGRPVEMCCAIGDEKVDGVPYEDIMLTAKMYVKQIGGFEAFAEWGLIR